MYTGSVVVNVGPLFPPLPTLSDHAIGLAETIRSCRGATFSAVLFIWRGVVSAFILDISSFVNNHY